MTELLIAIEKNLLDYILICVQIVTLFFLILYARDTRRIARDTYQARLDEHLPILEVKKITQQRIVADSFDITFDIENLGFKMFTNLRLVLNTVDFPILHNEIIYRLNNFFELKFQNKDIRKFKKLSLKYLDVHGREITTKVMLRATEISSSDWQRILVDNKVIYGSK